MKHFKTLLLAAILGISVVGCGNTAEGVKEDTEINKEKAAEAGQAAGEGTKDLGEKTGEAARDLSAAAVLTPKVKLAITGNEQLKDPKNLINVDSTEETVTLKGHVTSEEMKTLASTVAQKAMTDNNAKQKLVNELDVIP